MLCKVPLKNLSSLLKGEDTKSKDLNILIVLFVVEIRTAEDINENESTQQCSDSWMVHFWQRLKIGLNPSYGQCGGLVQALFY